MDAASAVIILNFLIAEATKIYIASKEAHGEAIPNWDTLIANNAALQAKIDAEK
jgi:hypothetical protein